MQDTMPISDELSLTKIKAKTALMLRVGGLGDCLILLPVAKELHKRGYKVDYFCGSPTGKVFELFKDLPYLNQVKEIKRIQGIDCVPHLTDSSENFDATFVSVEILKPRYDEVFDFKNSIEENRPQFFFNKDEGWRHTVNSNYVNWIDLSLAWANIDPTKVLDKSPEISIPEKYTEWVKTTLLSANCKKIGIQLQASTLVRSWYRFNELPELIHKEYPNDLVIIFSGNKWFALSQHGREEIPIPEDFNPLLCSAVIIKEMDCFISADSGSSHLAEAVQTSTIGLYTTVPSWTRVRDYKFAYPINGEVECHPCFSLDLFCPLEVKKVKDSMTDREKRLMSLIEKRTDPFEIAKEFNTVPKAIELEFQAIQTKMQALSAKEPACISHITEQMILDKVNFLLGKVKML